VYIGEEEDMNRYHLSKVHWMTIVFFDLKILSSHFPKFWTKLHFFL